MVRNLRLIVLDSNSSSICYFGFDSPNSTRGTGQLEISIRNLETEMHTIKIALRLRGLLRDTLYKKLVLHVPSYMCNVY